MRIYIESKYFSILLLPFIIWGVLYFFKIDIKDQVKRYISDKNRNIDINIDEKIAKDYFDLDKELNMFKELSKMDKDDKEMAKNIFMPYINKAEENRGIKKRAGWVLKYVLISGRKKVAFINGKIVKIGEKVDGATILDIKKDRVKLNTKEGIKWIELLK